MQLSPPPIAESSGSADTWFRADFERRAAGRFTIRLARPEDVAFLRQLFSEVYAEAARRAGSDLTPLMQPPLLNLQFESQRASYAGAYPSACHYIVACRSERSRPIGRMLIDWSGDRPVVGIDLAVLPDARRGAAGLHLLRSWVTTCDRFGRWARLHVMPDNPARLLYRKLGFVEADAFAFPRPMCRRPRDIDPG